jgi:hypothetical protein
LSDDLQQLETFKFSTWIKLAKAYRDLFPVKSIFSGLSNRYDKIFYAFLIAITISGLGMLSDVIICRAKWNNPGILHERDIMLDDN